MKRLVAVIVAVMLMIGGCGKAGEPGSSAGQETRTDDRVVSAQTGERGADDRNMEIDEDTKAGMRADAEESRSGGDKTADTGADAEDGKDADMRADTEESRSDEDYEPLTDQELTDMAEVDNAISAWMSGDEYNQLSDRDFDCLNYTIPHRTNIASALFSTSAHNNYCEIRPRFSLDGKFVPYVGFPFRILTNYCVPGA